MKLKKQRILCRLNCKAMLSKPSHRGHGHLAVRAHTRGHTRTHAHSAHTLPSTLPQMPRAGKHRGRGSQERSRSTSESTGLFSTYWAAQASKAISLLQRRKLFYSLWVEINDKLLLFLQCIFKARYKNKSLFSNSSNNSWNGFSCAIKKERNWCPYLLNFCFSLHSETNPVQFPLVETVSLFAQSPLTIKTSFGMKSIGSAKKPPKSP